MSDSPETILITGASSGLGLAFVEHYASIPAPSTPTIIAIDHQPFPLIDAFIDPASTIHYHPLDITNSDDVQKLATDYARASVNLVIHCAGIRGLVPSIVSREKDAGRVVANAETLEAMDKETMMRTFEVNTWGTFNLIKAFLPCLLSSSSSSQTPTKTKTTRPRVVVLSSRMSSISANSAGGGYAYRASKAALNAVVRSFAIDVPQVQFLLLHPGRVETELVAWKEEGAVSVEESIGDCLKVLERMTEEEWASGKLVDRFGVEIGW